MKKKKTCIKNKISEFQWKSIHNLICTECRLNGRNGIRGGVSGMKKDTNNCTDKTLDFCEKLLRIENAKTNIKLEKALRLGKKKMDATKPRSIVVKFGKLEDREMVRSISNRLKGIKFGISPHYPQDVLEKHKQLIPIMLKERKNKKRRTKQGINCRRTGSCGSNRSQRRMMLKIIKMF